MKPNTACAIIAAREFLGARNPTGFAAGAIRPQI